MPPDGVRTIARGPSTRPSRRAWFQAANPFPAWPCWSTSITSGPGWPVATPMLRPGWAVHQARILAWSVVASLNPRGVSGIFWPGATGNTGQPWRA